MLVSRPLRFVAPNDGKILTVELTWTVLWHEQDVEVPETILKKRKQNEKAREERLVAATAARKASTSSVSLENYLWLFGYDAYFTTSWLVETSFQPCCQKLYHLSGLNLLPLETQFCPKFTDPSFLL